MTEEHWIPQSWREFFPLPKIFVTRRSDEGERGATDVEYRTPYDQRWGGICGPCNSDWLRKLDEASKARLLNLAYKTTTTIPASEVHAVAMALTRAALMKIWGDKDEHGYPSGAFRQFRDSAIPPDGTHVFVGFGVEPFIYAGGHHASMVRTDGRSDGTHIVAWGLGWLFVLVVVPRDANVSLASTAASAIARVSRAAGRPLVKLWPRKRGAALNLPLTDQLSREFALFMTQAKTLITGQMPIIMEDMPEKLEQLMDVPEEELAKWVRMPSKPLPRLSE